MKFPSFILAATLLALASISEAGDRPNVLVFLVDDLGVTDATLTGDAFYETPNIQRLAGRGQWLLRPSALRAVALRDPDGAISVFPE